MMTGAQQGAADGAWPHAIIFGIAVLPPPDFGRERALGFKGQTERKSVLKKQLAIGAGLLLLNLAASGFAGAQTIYTGPGVSEAVLPPFEIMSIVRTTGLTPLTRPMRRGPYYVLVAVDRVGRQMRVVVDAQLGDIVNLRPALAASSYGPEVTRPIAPPGAILPSAGPPMDPGPAAAYGTRPSADVLPPPAPPRPFSHPSADISPLPTPPRPIPNPHASATTSPALPPSRLAVAEPAEPPPPPLPRPRPKLASNDAPDAPAASAPKMPAPSPAPAASPASGQIE
jgi:hypothetical protein